MSDLTKEERIEDAKQYNNLSRQLIEVADELGTKLSVVTYCMYYAIHRLLGKEREKQEADRIVVTAKMLVNELLKMIYANYGSEVRSILLEAGIESSVDIGKMVLVMTEKELGIMKEPTDQLSDFEGLFTTMQVDDYMKQEGLLPAPATDYYRTIAYALYFTGSALVVGGYVRIIPYQISWIGWVVGMTGWALTYFRKNIERWISRFKKKPVVDKRT